MKCCLAFKVEGFHQIDCAHGGGFCLCPFTRLDFKSASALLGTVPEILATAMKAIVGHSVGAGC